MRGSFSIPGPVFFLTFASGVAERGFRLGNSQSGKTGGKILLTMDRSPDLTIF